MERCLCVRAGGLTVHHVRTLHASAQLFGATRLVTPFFAADAFPIRVDRHPRYVGSSTNCELSPAPSRESIVAGSPPNGKVDTLAGAYRSPV